MAGQIIKRGENVWLVRIFMGRDDRGKRRYFNKTIRGTKKEAQSYLTAALREKDLGVFVEPANMSVNEYLDKWLQSAAKPRVSEATYTFYERLVKRYIRPAFGLRKLSEVQPLDIQALYQRLLEKGLSATTVRHVHAVLTSAFKQALKWRLLVFNPTASVELPRQVRKEMKSFSPEEAGRFLKAAAEDKWGIVFAFALATGMRPEEYLALQWKDVDFGRGIVTVQRTLIRRAGGGWYFGEPKTPRSRRPIPLPASLLKSLAEHRRRQSEHRLKLGPEYNNLDFVFAERRGGPLDGQNLLRRHFRPILRRAGLSEAYRLYDLRHSCATLLLSANEHPKVVSERLGHANISLTLDVYSHVLPSMQQAATDKLERV
jgi:integrase